MRDKFIIFSIMVGLFIFGGFFYQEFYVSEEVLINDVSLSNETSSLSYDDFLEGKINIVLKLNKNVENIVSFKAQINDEYQESLSVERGQGKNVFLISFENNENLKDKINVKIKSFETFRPEGNIFHELSNPKEFRIENNRSVNVEISGERTIETHDFPLKSDYHINYTIPDNWSLKEVVVSGPYGSERIEVEEKTFNMAFENIGKFEISSLKLINNNNGDKVTLEDKHYTVYVKRISDFEFIESDFINSNYRIGDFKGLRYRIYLRDEVYNFSEYRLSAYKNGESLKLSPDRFNEDFLEFSFPHDDQYSYDENKIQIKSLIRPNGDEEEINETNEYKLSHFFSNIEIFQKEDIMFSFEKNTLYFSLDNYISSNLNLNEIVIDVDGSMQTYEAKRISRNYYKIENDFYEAQKITPIKINYQIKSGNTLENKIEGEVFEIKTIDIPKEKNVFDLNYHQNYNETMRLNKKTSMDLDFESFLFEFEFFEGFYFSEIEVIYEKEGEQKEKVFAEGSHGFFKTQKKGIEITPEKVFQDEITSTEFISNETQKNLYDIKEIGFTYTDGNREIKRNLNFSEYSFYIGPSLGFEELYFNPDPVMEEPFRDSNEEEINSSLSSRLQMNIPLILAIDEKHKEENLKIEVSFKQEDEYLGKLIHKDYSYVESDEYFYYNFFDANTIIEQATLVYDEKTLFELEVRLVHEENEEHAYYKTYQLIADTRVSDENDDKNEGIIIKPK